MKGRRERIRIYALGDLHGAGDLLCQVLPHFNFDLDELVFIGDLADGWCQLDDCLYYLSKVKNFQWVLGNHDLYLKSYINKGEVSDQWLKQGGESTLKQLNTNSKGYEWLCEAINKATPYFIKQGILFVHGGFETNKRIESQSVENLATNRTFFKKIQQGSHSSKVQVISKEPVTKIIIGHSTCPNKLPVTIKNVTNIDTGAGGVGKLCLYDCFSNEYMLSESAEKHYSDEQKKQHPKRALFGFSH